MYSSRVTLAQQSSQSLPGNFFAAFASLWCCAIVVGVGHFVAVLIAIIQILSRSMPTDAKILWCAVTWFVPLIGPILWWTIGSKQHPPPSNHADGFGQ